MEKNVKIANPAPLGLLGFGMATILLNIHNAGFMQVNAQVIALGFTLGGIAQIIAGILEFKAGNTFGGTAFTAYGLFWVALVLIWTNKLSGTAIVGPNENSLAMGFFLLLWCLFTIFMFIGTLKHAVISRIVFGSLALLFLLLSGANLSNNETILNIAGYVGIFTGLSAFYNAVAVIVNNEFDENIFPL